MHWRAGTLLVVFAVTASVYAQPPVFDTWQDALGRGLLNQRARNYPDAQRVLLQALNMLGDERKDRRSAVTLTALGSVYQDLGNAVEAESCYKRALAGWDSVDKPERREVVATLNSLLSLYLEQKAYSSADRLASRAYAFMEVLDPKSLPAANTAHILAALADGQGKYDEAVLMYGRAAKMFASVAGEGAPEVAIVLNNMSLCHSRKGRYEAATAAIDQAVAILQQRPESNYLALAKMYANLGALQWATGRLTEAEASLGKAMTTSKAAFGQEHPLWASIAMNYAFILRNTGRKTEARALEKQSKAVLSATANARDLVVDIRDLTSKGRAGQ